MPRHLNVIGTSGRAMLAAIIAGEENPERPADLAVGTARRKRADLIEALRGRVTPHHRDMLKLHLQLIGALQGALDIVYFAALHAYTLDEFAVGVFDDPTNLANLIASVLSLILGVVLLFGARGLSALIARLRYGA